MTAQSSLPRLFVAVWPPTAVVDSLAALPRDAALNVTWEPPHLAHVTLRYLGPCDTADAVAALTQLRSPVVTAELGPAVSMLGPSVVCVPVSGLEALAAGVLACTSAVGSPSTHPGFTGHITVARLRRGATCALVGHGVSGSFEVASVALVRSEPPSAADPVRRYVTVARFALDRRRMQPQ